MKKQLILFIAAVVILNTSIVLSAPDKQVIFNSTLAGQWYPADANTLKNDIAKLFQKSDIKPDEDTIALILPHAGYQYSGRTAAMGLQTLGKQYKRIIIIGPSHYAPIEDVLSVPQADIYQTPLGKVALDVDFINKLLKYPQFQSIEQANLPEHSTQIQVPLLQYVQKDFKLVPIVAGQCSGQTISKVASILKGMIDNDTLIIASSDFTHYGPSYDYVPFKNNIPQQLKDLDMGAYKFIEKLDCNGFMDYRKKTGDTICGYIPISILLSMLDKSSLPQLINYSTSGQLTGDFNNSVSYFSIAFSGQWSKSLPVKQQSTVSGSTQEDKQQSSVTGLTQDDKKQLLTLARNALVLVTEKRQTLKVSDADFSSQLKRPGAAFVTLNKLAGSAAPGSHKYQLRGCIGDIFPRQPLYNSVIYNTILAARNDTRFVPVVSDELKDIKIEISVLTAPQPVASAEEIRVGIDGVVLKIGERSAVFLPQVATEQNWTREEMLKNLSIKAGLSPDAWEHGADFLTFQAEVFGETEK
ncbi:MAG: AmmeMemoRadiSam system protein B [Sedimentisphaerales bacterium]|jgi:AmmeMemoRadiSam system protein B/AmmeMemoRadiSam system protein A